MSSSEGEDLDLEDFLEELMKRPKRGMTEMRRDGKDDAAVGRVIKAEFEKRQKQGLTKKKFEHRMKEFAKACWVTMEAMHQLFLDDEKPENEKEKMDPDHWYENNLTNASLFANLTLDGLPQLVPGRLFTTRMPRDIVKDPQERKDFVHKCKVNNLRVICPLTEEEEFAKYSGMEGLLEFYREECGLVVYNRAIPDFKIPTSGDLVNNILDLTYHLSKGRNCLIHCAGGTGRTGMVLAAVIKNLGVYDYIARIRRVKSTYVETYEQELFLKNFPKAIDERICRESPLLAKAIAAEHLLQVFLTHGENIAKKEELASKNAIAQSFDGSAEEDKLTDAYRQTFKLIDLDGSGTLDRDELTQWMTMCGAELDVEKIIGALLAGGEDNLTMDKFASIMCAQANSCRRAYDIDGSVIGSH